MKSKRRHIQTSRGVWSREELFLLGRLVQSVGGGVGGLSAAAAGGAAGGAARELGELTLIIGEGPDSALPLSLLASLPSAAGNSIAGSCLSIHTKHSHQHHHHTHVGSSSIKRLILSHKRLYRAPHL